MPTQVNHLGVPPMDLTITDAGNGRLKVELQVPPSSGSRDNIPFLEVTRNEQATLLNGARQDMISKLSQSGLQIGEIQYEASAGRNDHVGGSASGNVPKIGKVSFEISTDSNFQGSINGSLRNNPNVDRAIRETEQNFDIRRQDIYESRAREWYRNGGATLESNGQTYTVTPDAARTYINERHPLNPFERVGIDSETRVASAAPVIAPGNDQANRQFEQALRGTNGDPNAAAVALETIKNNPSYKQDQDISVVQGKNGGFVVSQGQGDGAVNLAVPQARQGDFERVSAQLAQAPQPPQTISQLDQPERTQRPPTV